MSTFNLAGLGAYERRKIGDGHVATTLHYPNLRIPLPNGKVYESRKFRDVCFKSVKELLIELSREVHSNDLQMRSMRLYEPDEARRILPQYMILRRGFLQLRDEIVNDVERTKATPNTPVCFADEASVRQHERIHAFIGQLLPDGFFPLFLHDAIVLQAFSHMVVYAAGKAGADFYAKYLRAYKPSPRKAPVHFASEEFIAFTVQVMEGLRIVDPTHSPTRLLNGFTSGYSYIKALFEPRVVDRVSVEQDLTLLADALNQTYPTQNEFLRAFEDFLRAELIIVQHMASLEEQNPGSTRKMLKDYVEGETPEFKRIPKKRPKFATTPRKPRKKKRTP